MGGRVVQRDRLIPAFGEDCAVADDDRTNGNFALLPCVLGEGEGVAHPVFV